MAMSPFCIPTANTAAAQATAVGLAGSVIVDIQSSHVRVERPVTLIDLVEEACWMLNALSAGQKGGIRLKMVEGDARKFEPNLVTSRIMSVAQASTNSISFPDFPNGS